MLSPPDFQRIGVESEQQSRSQKKVFPLRKRVFPLDADKMSPLSAVVPAVKGD